MKKQLIKIITGILMVSVFSTCRQADTSKPETQESPERHQVGAEEHGEENVDEVHLSDLKFKSLGMKIDTLPARALSGVVEANGQLEVPPQHEATVTAILGANVTSIQVIEGDKVRKGQVLAYLSHPNLTQLQIVYMKTYSRMQYLEKEYQRQKRLYKEQVGSGKTFQQTQAEYQGIKGEVKGYGVQLKQLGMNVERIRKGNIYESVPVVSPIDGYIEKVLVQVGQYVDPQKNIFMIVNNEHVHADLMVFEKDIYKVKKGQKISFTVQSVPGKILSATIFSVGKQFEQTPKAVHVHAEIERKENFLIPGMYINGRIHTESKTVQTLPEDAFVEAEGKTYIFTAEKHEEDGKSEWSFRPIEVKTGMENKGWVEVKLLKPLSVGTQVAWNNAYYLIAEMKKGETAHSH